jgi:hypothetical protein
MKGFVENGKFINWWFNLSLYFLVNLKQIKQTQRDRGSSKIVS